MIELRPYQVAAVNKIRAAYIAGKRAPLLVMPTGSGKTFTFSYIAQNSSQRNKRVLILVHRVELLRQTSRSLSKLGVRHGLINPKYTPNLQAMVQVASVQTLIKRLDKIQPPDLIVVDEAHHAAGANTWGKVLLHFEKARVLGVTATPERADGQGLGSETGGYFDELIIGPSVRQLIDEGALVDYVVYAPKDRIDLTQIRVVMGEYDKKEVTAAVDKPTITGDAVANYRKYCNGVPAIAFCASVQHAEHVAQAFRDAGYLSYSVDGSMDDDTRQRLIGGLENGKVQVLTSADLISEGTDIPAVTAAILLRPTKSKGLHIQQVGRALRPSPETGKTHAIILDHVGNTLTHGLPDAVHEWTLEGSKKNKGKKQNTINVMQCTKCFAIHAPAPKCPICGHVYPVKSNKGTPEQTEGELQMITREQAEMMRKESRMEVGKAKSLEDLIEIARQRGYKSGWAHHIWNSRKTKAGATTTTTTTTTAITETNSEFL